MFFDYFSYLLTLKNKIVKSGSRNSMNKLKSKYYHDTFGIEDSVLKSIRQQATQDDIEFMQLDPADASILQFLTQLSQSRKALEIGGLYGYSTLHIARGLHPKGKVFSLDIDLQRQEKAQELISQDPCFSKIQWVHGDAHQTLKTLEEHSPFDLIFIDADKAGYLRYFEWAEKNLKTGGLLVADNTFLFDTLFTEEPELTSLRKQHAVSKQSVEVLKTFNQKISSSNRWKGAMIPTENGIGVSIKIQ